MKTVIYPGTFDPLTLGHQDVIKRALGIFDRVIVAVAENTNKNTLFTLQERVELATHVLKKHKNVEVHGFDNLLIDFAHSKNVNIILRGLRVVADFEYEYQLTGMNRHLAPDIETLFVMPTEEHAYISSGFVREVARLHGDVSKFVDPQIATALKNKFKK